MKVSIKQISEATGFSPATVSNALNRRKGVGAATLEKILKEADRLGYQSGKAATSIRFVTYRKNGLIIDDSQIFPAMIEGVEQQAKEQGYVTTFSRLNYEDGDFEERLFEVLEDTGSIMILLATEMMEEDFVPFREFKGRLVLLDGWSEKMDFDGILINNTDAACHAVEYLLDKGHRRIGYLRGDYRIKGFRYREYGYRRALERHGILPDPVHTVTTGTRLESAYEGMKRYLETDPVLPTAYFADNDVIAIGAMRAMQEKGIRIPKDVSLIGFDDTKFGVISTPGLTTVHVYKEEMGATAVRRALDYVKGQERSEKMKIQVCTTFVERESVSSPAQV